MMRALGGDLRAVGDNQHLHPARELLQPPTHSLGRCPTHAGVDLVAPMLHYTPNKRIVAKDALEHPYFANLDKATVGTIPLPI